MPDKKESPKVLLSMELDGLGEYTKNWTGCRNTGRGPDSVVGTVGAGCLGRIGIATGLAETYSLIYPLHHTNGIPTKGIT